MKNLVFGFSWLALAAAFAAPPMMTPWGEKVTPDNCWREYPRPQMVRGNWINLCGLWNYAIRFCL